MRFMSRTFHLACALLLATAATPLHAAKADRILIVVSGEENSDGFAFSCPRNKSEGDEWGGMQQRLPGRKPGGVAVR